MAAAWDGPPTGTEISNRSWASFRGAYRAMAPLYLDIGLVYALLALAETAFRVLQPQLYNSMTVGAYSAILSPFRLVEFAFVAPAAVATHRFILLGEVTPSIWALKPARVGSYFFWLVVLDVSSSIAVLPLHYLREAARDNRFILLAFALARLIVAVLVIFVFLRMAMIFPATAIGAPSAGLVDRARMSWVQMRGHVWLFIRAAILVILPMAIPLIALDFFITTLLPAMGWEGFSLPDPNSTQDIWKGLVSAFTAIVFAVLDAGVASWLYAWVATSHTGSLAGEP